MSETKHTPLPWEYRTGGESNGESYPPHVVHLYRDEQGRRCTAFLANCESATHDNEANAQLIVTAVNARSKVEELVEIILRNVNSNPRLWSEQLVAKAREVESALGGKAE